MESREQNGILASAIQKAITKIAEKGIENCTTKDVILASFGSLSFNGGLATSEEVNGLAKDIRKCFSRTIGVTVAIAVSVIMALIFT